MRKSQELQMQVNDALSCRGSCQGCVLAPGERRTSLPDMPERVLELASSRMAEYAAAAGPVERVNVIFGIGDHVIYGAEYLARIHSLGSRAVLAGKPSDPARSVVFFTTSLVGRREEVRSVLRRTRGLMSGPVAFVPQVVLDGRLMNAAKFGPMWRGMVAEAKSLFGRVDLATNLSGDATRHMRPWQLLEFARSNGFDEVSVMWSPTMGNAAQTVGEGEAIAAWLLEFDDLMEEAPELQTTYRPVVAKLLSAFAERDDGEQPDLATVVSETVPETVRKAFDIELDGSIVHKFEAVGDVTHARRHGFVPAGNVADGPIAETLERAIPAVQARILAIHAKGGCSSCPVSNVCAGTGFHIATHVARKSGFGGSGQDCPHIARAVIERVAERVRRGDRTVAAFRSGA